MQRWVASERAGFRTAERTTIARGLYFGGRTEESEPGRVPHMDWAIVG